VEDDMKTFITQSLDTKQVDMIVGKVKKARKIEAHELVSIVGGRGGKTLSKKCSTTIA